MYPSIVDALYNISISKGIKTSFRIYTFWEKSTHFFRGIIDQGRPVEHSKMASRMGMIGCLIVVVALLNGATAQVTSAGVYEVGDSLGWTVPPNTSYYTNWASTKTFFVGDRLSKQSWKSFVLMGSLVFHNKKKTLRQLWSLSLRHGNYIVSLIF